MKATSIFGGVQVFNILITLVRGKAVALLIGTAGMGLNGLLMSGVELIRAISSLGINESAVKEISKANSSGDHIKIRKTAHVFKKLIWLTAVLGILGTILFSPLLSRFSFGDESQTTSFMWLSLTFIFGALSGGVYTMLRGTRQLKYLAQSNVIGALVGLIVALPIFYFYGIKGVVPAIIITAFGNYLVSLYFKSKIRFEPIAMSWKESFEVGAPIVKLGLSMTLVSVLSSAVSFTLIAFISKTGRLSDVGLYAAGNAIVQGYVGMVFTAMSTDYFPRLAGVIKDKIQWKKLVNEQAELVLIILGIVLVLLITTTPILIRLLLSKEFTASQNFIQFAALAIPLKGLVWVMGYVILAKSDNKLFITVEVIASLVVLCFNVLFYYLYGLTGLGISLTVSYLISVVLMLVILYKKYNFNFTSGVYKLLAINMLSLSLCLLSIHTLKYAYSNFAQGIIVILAIYFFVYEFNKRIRIKSIFNKFRRK